MSDVRMDSCLEENGCVGKLVEDKSQENSQKDSSSQELDGMKNAVIGSSKEKAQEGKGSVASSDHDCEVNGEVSEHGKSDTEKDKTFSEENSEKSLNLKDGSQKKDDSLNGDVKKTDKEISLSQCDNDGDAELRGSRASCGDKDSAELKTENESVSTKSSENKNQMSEDTKVKNVETAEDSQNDKEEEDLSHEMSVGSDDVKIGSEGDVEINKSDVKQKDGDINVDSGSCEEALARKEDEGSGKDDELLPETKAEDSKSDSEPNQEDSHSVVDMDQNNQSVEEGDSGKENSPCVNRMKDHSKDMGSKEKDVSETSQGEKAEDVGCKLILNGPKALNEEEGIPKETCEAENCDDDVEARSSGKHATGSQDCENKCEKSLTKCEKLSAECEKSSTECEKSSAECEKSSAECEKSSAECEKSSAECEKSSAECEKSSAECEKSSAECEKSSAECEMTSVPVEKSADVSPATSQACDDTSKEQVVPKEISKFPVFEDISDDDDGSDDENLENIELELDDLIDPSELNKSSGSDKSSKGEVIKVDGDDDDKIILQLSTGMKGSEANTEQDPPTLSPQNGAKDDFKQGSHNKDELMEVDDQSSFTALKTTQVKKSKVTARKSGKPVAQLESSVLKKVNLHPIKDVTMKLSDIEEALAMEPPVKAALNHSTHVDGVIKVPGKKKRRKNTYDFPGCKKKSKRLKLSDELGSSGSSADSVLSLSDVDQQDSETNSSGDKSDHGKEKSVLHHFLTQPIVCSTSSSDSAISSTLSVTSSMSTSQSKDSPRCLSPSSLSGPKAKKMKTVLEMLHERNRLKQKESKQGNTVVTSSSTSTTTTYIVSPPPNKPIVEASVKRKGVPRKRRESDVYKKKSQISNDDVICLSDSDDEDQPKIISEGKKKRGDHGEKISLLTAASTSSNLSSFSRGKTVSGISSRVSTGTTNLVTNTVTPRVITGTMPRMISSQAPVVMVVTQHSNSPGLRSLLPRQGAKAIQPTQAGIVGGFPLISTLPVGAKAISMASLPPGVMTSLPAGSQAMTFLTPISPSQAQGLVNATSTAVTPGKSGKSQPKSSPQLATTQSDSLRALLVGKPYTLARVTPSSLSTQNSPVTPVLLQMVSTSGSNLVPIPATSLLSGAKPSTSSSLSLMSTASTTSSTVSSTSSSLLSTSFPSFVLSRPSPKSTSSASSTKVQGTPVKTNAVLAKVSSPPLNGVTKVSPQKKALSDLGCASEVAASASLARPVAGQVEDCEVIPLCCCKINGALFNKLHSDLTYCQALDTVDSKVFGCFNKVSNAQLVRPGVKIPFMAVCEVHRKRLKLHQCCPGCGHFCTQGTFQQCHKEGTSSVHLFHKQCMFYRGGKHYCPHCGEETGQAEVELKLNETKQEPEVKVNARTARREAEKKKVRMCLNNFVKSKSTNHEKAETLKLPNNKSVTLDGSLGPDQLTLTRLCRCAADDRPKKYRTMPKDLYKPASEGDMERVFYLLVDGLSPNTRYEEREDQTAMHAAAISGHLGTVFILHQFGGELHNQDKTLRTPLMCAAENGNLKVVQYLIKAGAKVEDRGEDGMTSLHYAAKAGHIEIIKYILETGDTDINIQDDGGWTPIIWATESLLSDVVKYLLSNGGDPNKKDNEENTGLHWASYSGSLDIAEMFLELGCEIDTPNEHGDRALHIAARQDHYDIVVLLLARGADVDTKNNKGETPVEACVNKSGQVWMALKVNQQLRSFAARKLIQPEKLLERDVTMGREKNPIACVNAEDNEACPTDFLYVVENVETSPLNINYVITSLQSCRCKDDCSSMYCVCGRSSIKCWYDKMGRLEEDVSLVDPPLVFECNRACRCWVNCNNRVVQNGITCRLQLFRTNGRGWGVRTLMDVPKGTFVCEYIGELISDSEADRREDDSYLFDLDNKDGDTYCIDARKYGNISRFINHLCEPNLVPVKVFVEHQDLRFPRICLFASRDIQAYEELGFDYGEKFWMIKWKHFTCACKSTKCKYSSETIKRTLADYKLRYPDENVDS